MQILHNNYVDSNNLVFENVTVLGLNTPPTTVTIRDIDGNIDTTLPVSSIQYDSVKKVSKCMGICRIFLETLNVSIVSYFCSTNNRPLIYFLLENEIQLCYMLYYIKCIYCIFTK